MKKGWFKKAKKKFIRKKVFSFNFYDTEHSDWNLDIKNNGSSGLQYSWISSEAEQVLLTLRNYGTFYWRFMKARELHFKEPKKYGFYWEKKITV